MSGESDALSVTVVGAGVIGLTSAIRLAEAGHRVRIVAREFSPHTTSDVAAAVWYPFHVAPRARVLDWAAEAYREFAGVAETDPEAGVTLVSGVELFPARVADPWWAAALPDVRRAGAEEIPIGYTDGLVFTVPVVAMNTYQPWLRRRAESLGVTLEQGTADSLPLLLDAAQVIVNCSGLGSRELAADLDLHPVRGQIVRVSPGFTDRFVQATSGPGPIAYIIPRPDCTVLGGTADPDAWDLTPDPSVEAAILERCTAIEPRLAGATVVGRAVGLRPARSEIRLDEEVTQRGLVVHNYGHGGAGVTVSWGCAAEVAERVAAWASNSPTASGMTRPAIDR